MATTETASRRFASIEDWSTEDLVHGIIEGQLAAIAAVQAAAGPIIAAIDAAAERLRDGSRLIYAGAGTSGRIAAQDAAELPPTFNWPYERAVAVMAGGPEALLRSTEGAEDSREEARARAAALALSTLDVVIAVAASGGPPIAVGARGMAREVGALGIGVYNNAGGSLGEAADIPILVQTGAELLAGSTRMKAGTAQKAVLNCLSTGVMIRLGFVYRGRMVEMRPTNAKLAARAEAMVAELAGSDLATAAAALAEAGGSIKLAVVMLCKGTGRAEAEALLGTARGDLRAALA